MKLWSGKIVDRLLYKRLLIGLTSIGNNDGDAIDPNEGEIEGDKDESVTDGEEIVVSEGIVVDNRNVINNNISNLLWSIKGTCSDDTSFLFLSFNSN